MPELIAPAFLLVKMTQPSILIIPGKVEKIRMTVFLPIPGKVEKIPLRVLLPISKGDLSHLLKIPDKSGLKDTTVQKSNSGQSGKRILEHPSSNSGHLYVQMTVK